MTLWVLCITLALMALVLFAYALKAFRRKHLFGGLSRVLLGTLLLSLGLLAAVISISIRGYQALTQEQVAATITIEKTAGQTFTAQLRFPDNKQQSFNLSGDEVAIDAHILKWHPWANLLGLHTAYQFDRIYGRYTSIEDEQNKTRTVYTLAQPNPLNFFELGQRLKIKTLLDTEYGSSTFLAVQDKTIYEIRVSASGLLIRQVE